MSFDDKYRSWLEPLSAAIPLIIIFISILSIVLTTANSLALSTDELSSWIVALYALPGIVGLILSLYYRQPLLFTGNVFMFIFIGSLGGEIAYAELIGASMIAGIGIVLVSIFRLSHYLTKWIPASIVFGLLAGAIVPFVVGIFNSMNDTPVLVVTTFLVYLLSRRFLNQYFPPILPALLIGLLVAFVTGQIGQVPSQLSLPSIFITLPRFSVQTILTIVPIFIVIITLQANLPSLIFLETQDYSPPKRVIDLSSGIGTLIASLLGPTGFSLSLPATSLIASPVAGATEKRYRAALIASIALVLIGLFAGLAAELPSFIPLPLLLSLAGLSMLDVLANALREITKGPLVLGPLLAFVIVLSDLSLFGFGDFFWGLLIGIGVSYLLERDGLQNLAEA